MQGNKSYIGKSPEVGVKKVFDSSFSVIKDSSAERVVQRPKGNN